MLSQMAMYYLFILLVVIKIIASLLDTLQPPALTPSFVLF